MTTTTPQDARDERPLDPLAYERGFWGRSIFEIAGVDEAGRGPLAGPVVAAAVVLAPECWIEGARDSKQLTREERSEIYERIRGLAVAIGVGAASTREIDRVNILRATSKAMDRALRALRCRPRHVVVDGLPMKDLPWDHEAVVDGDAKVHSVSCASIVAKVSRDRLMGRLALKYPRYKWETNMGYGTPDHIKALTEWGPSPHHRLTFRGAQLTLELED